MASSLDSVDTVRFHHPSIPSLLAAALPALSACATSRPPEGELYLEGEDSQRLCVRFEEVQRPQVDAERGAEAEANSDVGADEPASDRRPYTEAPELLNVTEASRIFRNRVGALPIRARRALVWVRVSETGEPLRSCISESSGSDRIDRIVLQTTRVTRFNPALRAGRPVEVWVQIPMNVPAAPPPEGPPEPR